MLYDFVEIDVRKKGLLHGFVKNLNATAPWVYSSGTPQIKTVLLWLFVRRGHHVATRTYQLSY